MTGPYQIVTAIDVTRNKSTQYLLDELMEKVNETTRHGWQPLGGTFVIDCGYAQTLFHPGLVERS